MAQAMTISEVATTLEINAHTLRYYERAGLLEGIGRNQGGHRRYSEDDLVVVDFLIKMRGTGMGISQLRAYVQAARRGEDTLEYRKEVLERQRAKVVAKIEELNSCLAVIDWKLENYACGISSPELSCMPGRSKNGTEKNR